MRMRLVAACFAGAVAAVPEAAAQVSLDLGGALLADADEQRYLRLLALVDSSVVAPVVLQPFGRRAERDARRSAAQAMHPWRAHFSAFTADRPTGFEWSVLRPDAQFVFLSDRPQHRKDGVLWTGRGSTVAVQGGARAQWRWLRAQLAPVAFAAQNADFAVIPNGSTDPYRDARFPANIDLPQRFGDGGYSRVDWGDSFVEAETLGLLAGFSNARIQWGPASEYPLVLGTGGGGFAHAHLGSAAPLPSPLGAVQVRWVVGRLEQSSHSPVQTGQTARFVVAFFGSFSPRFAPGIEIGASRLINGPWPEGGLSLSSLARPFEDIVNDNAGPVNQNPDNGFASAFIRIAPQGSGLEAYAELSRDDFSGDSRQLLLEPDDLAQYTIGVSRAQQRGSRLTAIRVELTNGEVAHHDRPSRGLQNPSPPYIHSGTNQGLTNRGQLLGSFGTYGGAAATVSWEAFDAGGRRRFSLERVLLHDWLRTGDVIGGTPAGEVRYSLRAERLQFRAGADVTLSAGVHYTINRNLVDGRDAFGLEFGARWRGW
jgi:hypothetical protein